MLQDYDKEVNVQRADSCVTSLSRLLRLLLSDLLTAGVVSLPALQAWRYHTFDTDAVKDVSAWLNILKDGDDADVASA
jgi:hypothetical protein